MNLGEFFLAIFEYLYGFWPLRIVHAWEQGLRMFNGTVRKQLDPGLHWFVPLFGEILSENTVLDVNLTSSQTVESADGHPITFSLAVKYEIISLQRMYERIQDHDTTVVNEVCASAAALVAEYDVHEIQEHLPEAIQGDVQDRLEEWGVGLHTVVLNDFCVARALRLLMGD